MNQDRVFASYVLHTTSDPEQVAATVAGEQSSGTFIAVPGEDEALKEKAAARVERIVPCDVAMNVALPGAKPGKLRAVELELSWPLDNLGHSLPNLVATVAGNLFELQGVAGLKLEDLRVPESFLAHYSGPAFGVDGTRRISSVVGRPLIGTIIKPSVGLTPTQTASLVAELCEGGIDFIKDDELQGDGPSCPFDKRVEAVMNVINRHADSTGRKPIFAFNITGDIDEMRRRHDKVLAAGGNTIMVSLNSVGLVGILELRRFSQLPIHAHRNGWGYLGRSPNNGWSYIAWQKLWRIAGVDHMHVNGLANKFWEPDDSVVASARACLRPLSEAHPYTVMPVFSSGQSVMQAAGTWARLGSPDLIYCAGGGIVAHPDGIGAGVRSLRAAWDAAMEGVPLDEAASRSTELRRAVETFG